MPINSESFEQSKTERAPSAPLAAFLSAHYRSAFSLDELVQAMAAMGKEVSRQDMEMLISSLVYRGKAESKIINEETYYRYAKPTRFKVI